MAGWGFWAAAFGITLGVFWIMSRALRGNLATSDDGASVAVYRDQLSEVDKDLARGVITADEAARLRVEVSRRLLDADRNRPSVNDGTPVARTGASLVIGAALLAAVAGYYWLGAPGYPDLPLATRLELAQAAYDRRPSQAKAEAAAPQPAPVQHDAEFSALMDKLRAAVISRPDDVQGLALLARNEMGLGNAIAARRAQQHLVDVKAGQATAQDHETLAQLMIAAAAGEVSPEAEAELIKALALEPDRGLARYFSGLMFAQTGRPDRTFALWQPLLDQGPPDAVWIAPIRAQIEEIAAAAGVRYSLPDRAGAKTPGPDAAAIAAADGLNDADRQAMIAGMVDQLATRLNTAGGPVEEWVRLINALMVLNQPDRAQAAVVAAKAAFAAQPAALATIDAAASQSGLAP